jgi:hypothetical protein
MLTARSAHQMDLFDTEAVRSLLDQLLADSRLHAEQGL